MIEFVLYVKLVTSKMKVISGLNVKKYSNYRRSFQCNIFSLLQKNHLSENQMLKFCMNSNSLKVTCSYINNCLTLRNEIIQY